MHGRAPGVRADMQASDLVKEGWILEVDADERVTDISDMMARLDRYTRMRALDLKESDCPDGRSLSSALLSQSQTGVTVLPGKHLFSRGFGASRAGCG